MGFNEKIHKRVITKNDTLISGTSKSSASFALESTNEREELGFKEELTANITNSKEQMNTKLDDFREEIITNSSLVAQSNEKIHKRVITKNETLKARSSSSLHSSQSSVLSRCS